MLSLRSKDRAEAKLRIPAHTVETDKLLADATRSLAGKPAPEPKAPLSPAQIERERSRWEAEQEQADHVAGELFATDMEAGALSPIMDTLSAGKEPEGSLADIARAGRLIGRAVDALVFKRHRMRHAFECPERKLTSAAIDHLCQAGLRDQRIDENAVHRFGSAAQCAELDFAVRFGSFEADRPDWDAILGTADVS